jgi:hypothetical protein
VVRVEERYFHCLYSLLHLFFSSCHQCNVHSSLPHPLPFSQPINIPSHRNRLPPSQTHTSTSQIGPSSRKVTYETRYQENTHMHAHHLVIFPPLQTCRSEIQIIIQEYRQIRLPHSTQPASPRHSSRHRDRGLAPLVRGVHADTLNISDACNGHISRARHHSLRERCPLDYRDGGQPGRLCCTYGKSTSRDGKYRWTMHRPGIHRGISSSWPYDLLAMKRGNREGHTDLLDNLCNERDHNSNKS